MGLEVHDTPNMIWIVSSGIVFVFFIIDNQDIIYPCFFCIQFFRYCVNIAFQHALTLAIEKMIMSTSDAYSRPPTTIRSHDLHVDGIRGAMGEITSYHMRD